MSATGNVWVVDDERSIRWVLEKALTQEGLHVTCFEDGQALLNVLADNPPDAIVSDIRMPGIDGLSLLERIKSTFPDLPVIIMTAHSDLDSAVSSIQGGAFEYIPKPFEVDSTVMDKSRFLLNKSSIKDEIIDKIIGPSTNNFFNRKYSNVIP